MDLVRQSFHDSLKLLEDSFEEQVRVRTQALEDENAKQKKLIESLSTQLDHEKAQTTFNKAAHDNLANRYATLLACYREELAKIESERKIYRKIKSAYNKGIIRKSSPVKERPFLPGRGSPNRIKEGNRNDDLDFLRNNKHSPLLDNTNRGDSPSRASAKKKRRLLSSRSVNDSSSKPPEPQECLMLKQSPESPQKQLCMLSNDDATSVCLQKSLDESENPPRHDIQHVLKSDNTGDDQKDMPPPSQDDNNNLDSQATWSTTGDENIPASDPFEIPIVKEEPCDNAKQELNENGKHESVSLDNRLPSLLEKYEINPQNNHGHHDAYAEVVRKHDERKKMAGASCDCCKGYYEKEHGDQSSAVNRKAAEEHQKRISRHRHHWAPPESPPGYWQMGFPDTQGVERINKEARKMEQRRLDAIEEEARSGTGKWKYKTKTAPRKTM